MPKNIFILNDIPTTYRYDKYWNNNKRNYFIVFPFKRQPIFIPKV